MEFGDGEPGSTTNGVARHVRPVAPLFCRQPLGGVRCRVVLGRKTGHGNRGSPIRSLDLQGSALQGSRQNTTEGPFSSASRTRTKISKPTPGMRSDEAADRRARAVVSRRVGAAASSSGLSCRDSSRLRPKSAGSSPSPSRRSAGSRVGRGTAERFAGACFQPLRACRAPPRTVSTETVRRSIGGREPRRELCGLLCPSAETALARGCKCQGPSYDGRVIITFCGQTLGKGPWSDVEEGSGADETATS